MTDEPSADPVAERRAVGREMSRKVGFPVWQVRVEVGRVSYSYMLFDASSTQVFGGGNG